MVDWRRSRDAIAPSSLARIRSASRARAIAPPTMSPTTSACASARSGHACGRGQENASQPSARSRRERDCRERADAERQQRVPLRPPGSSVTAPIA